MRQTTITCHVSPTTQCYFYFINIQSLTQLRFLSIFFCRILFCSSVHCCPLLALVRTIQSVFFNRKIRKMIISQICLKLDIISAHIWNPQFLANFGIFNCQVKKILKLLKSLRVSRWLIDLYCLIFKMKIVKWMGVWK